MLVLEVHRHVQKIVKPIVVAAWENCFAAVRVLKAPFELSVKASLRQLLQKETDVKAHLEAKIREIVLPHLQEIDSTICAPILESCCEPMLQACEQAVEGLQVQLCTMIHTVEPHEDAVRAAQTALQLAVEQGCVNSSSSLADAQKLLWTMHTEDLLDLQEIFEISGLAGFDVYSNALDDLKVLTQNALYTFGMFAFPSSSSSSSASATKAAADPASSDGDAHSESSGSTGANTRRNARPGDRKPKGKTSRQQSPVRSAAVEAAEGVADAQSHSRSTSSAGSKSRSRSKGRSNSSGGGGRVPISRTALLQALNQVVARMCSDSVLCLRAGLARLLTDAMEAKVQESMVGPCADVVRSAQALVTRDMQLMVNLHSIGEAMVREMVSDFVQNLLGRHVIKISSRMQDLADRLCCANPVPSDA
jgi:hypothetical protein